MKLLTKSIEAKLRANGTNPDMDHPPVVKFFTPWGSAVWLFSELAPDGDSLFGLCDLGQGFPELGWTSLRELTALRGPFGLKVERDLYFSTKDRMSVFTAQAEVMGKVSA